MADAVHPQHEEKKRVGQHYDAVAGDHSTIAGAHVSVIRLPAKKSYERR